MGPYCVLYLIDLPVVSQLETPLANHILLLLGLPRAEASLLVLVVVIRSLCRLLMHDPFIDLDWQKARDQGVVGLKFNATEREGGTEGRTEGGRDGR